MPNPIVITGASSGIGKATAHLLAARGLPLVLICREGAKARAAHSEIVRVSGNPAVELETADLSVQAQIRAVAASIRERHPQLGGLINNAGAAFSSRQVSADGIEMTLAVNHLAPFLLTNLLLEPLLAGAPARIITVSSDVQRPLRLDDLDRLKSYNGFDVYGETKLANVLFTFELARRLAGTRVSANALAPGFLRTALMRDSSRRTKLMFSVLGLVMMEPAHKGARRIVDLALSPALAGVTGEFFAKSQIAKAIPSAYDSALAGQLWAMSERLTGLSGVTMPPVQRSEADDGVA